MKYQGSKSRIASKLLKIMIPYRKNRAWIEPFVGGGNMIDKIREGVRIGADANFFTIQALKLIQNNLAVIPKNNTEFTKEDYLTLKNNYKKGKTSALMGFAGFAYSFQSSFFDSWATNNQGRDYVLQAFQNARKQSDGLQGIQLIHSEFNNLDIPEKSLIYCDPPYKNKKKYKAGFNHVDFWEWCRTKQKEGHLVFISEYSAPEDFKEVWSLQLNNTFNYKKATEKLFVHKSFSVKVGLFDSAELLKVEE